MGWVQAYVSIAGFVHPHEWIDNTGLLCEIISTTLAGM
jgi:hypothetical protein